MAGTVTLASAIGSGAPPSVLAPARRPARDPVAALDVFDEPAELLSELRGDSRERPAAARATAPGLLALHATAAWEASLETLGIPAEVVTQAFETCRREIWLWVDGDRRWDQLATHLAQRVARRA
jgi:hypothetical protein